MFGRAGINVDMIMASEKFVVKWIHEITNSKVAMNWDEILP